MPSPHIGRPCGSRSAGLFAAPSHPSRQLGDGVSNKIPPFLNAPAKSQFIPASSFLTIKPAKSRRIIQANSFLKKTQPSPKPLPRLVGIRRKVLLRNLPRFKLVHASPPDKHTHKRVYQRSATMYQTDWNIHRSIVRDQMVHSRPDCSRTFGTMKDRMFGREVEQWITYKGSTASQRAGQSLLSAPASTFVRSSISLR